MGAVKALPLLLFATAAAAHAPVATRTLRLQLRADRLEGLLVYHLPAQGARIFRATRRDAAVALTPRALAGLRIEADGAPLQPRVTDARARLLPDGSIEAVLLLDAGMAARTLRVAVDAAPPMPVELLAHSGVKLELAQGAGAPAPGGLVLRPRPGAPCLVAISAAAAKGTPR